MRFPTYTAAATATLLTLTACGDLGNPSPHAAEAVGEEVDEALDKIGPESTVDTPEPPAQVTPEAFQQEVAAAGGLLRLAPAAASRSIDLWVATLQGNSRVDDSEDMVRDLLEIKRLLAASPIDGEAIGERLEHLAAETHDAARDNEGNAAVERLSELLGEAAETLDD